MEKRYMLYASAACVAVAATCGALELGAAAFSFGLASIGLFFISTQFKG